MQYSPVDMIPMRRLFFPTVLLVSLFFVSCEGSKESPVFQVNNVALDGYDLVAYVMDQEAIRGKEENKISYQGLDYYFIRPSYRDEFLQHPEKYLPAYGGYCGYEVAKNTKRVASDPKLWIIQEGQLILFSDDETLNGKHKTDWVVKRRLLKQEADANWTSMN